jgi:DNA-directed RNA polymerase specialized sigma24 family protein
MQRYDDAVIRSYVQAHESLPLGWHGVWVLYWERGLSEAESAQELGISRAACRRRIERLRAAARAAVKNATERQVG